jgi:hypothetical protein
MTLIRELDQVLRQLISPTFALDEVTLLCCGTSAADHVVITSAIRCFASSMSERAARYRHGHARDDVSHVGVYGDLDH